MSSNEYRSALKQLAINPEYISYPLSWLGHIPFAAWLAETLKPRVFVELGSYSGTSYFSFCQAVLHGKLATKCFAVDTWKGDDHTGGYGEEVYQSFIAHNETHYSSFSRPLRMRFDAARAEFDESSVDLLHIDGLHTYEAVKEDFDTWLPKMSNVGVVIFHDTAVEAEGFGVNNFWAEISERYPSFNFIHSNGLGVLLVGKEYSSDSPLLNEILNIAPVVDGLAERLWLQQIVREQEQKLSNAQDTIDDLEQAQLNLKEAHSGLTEEVTRLAAERSALMVERADLTAQVQNFNLTVIPDLYERLEVSDAAKKELSEIKATKFWKTYHKIFSLRRLLSK